MKSTSTGNSPQKHPKDDITIIRLGSDIDLEAEIKAKADSMAIDTSALLNLRLQKTKSKKDKEKEYWAEKLELAANSLIEARNLEDKFVSRDSLLAVTGVDPKDFIRLASRLRHYLRIEDKWALVKKTMKGQPHYTVERFS